MDGVFSKIKIPKIKRILSQYKLSCQNSDLVLVQKPQTNTSKEPKHHSIGEVLILEDILTEDEIRKTVSISSIIKEGDIYWLASNGSKLVDLEIIQKYQNQIESALGNLSLSQIADGSKSIQIQTTLLRFGIENSAELAGSIVKEAKFWNSKI